MTSNKLSKAEIERITLVIEECAEVQQALTKVLRFGWESEYLGITNREIFTREVGDVGLVLNLMNARGDFSAEHAREFSLEKVDKLNANMKYNEIS